jgi:hypothetical protein
MERYCVALVVLLFSGCSTSRADRVDCAAKAWSAAAGLAQANSALEAKTQAERSQSFADFAEVAAAAADYDVRGILVYRFI